MEKLTNVELESIRLLDTKARNFPSEPVASFDFQEDVSTPFGPIRVVVHGNTRLPAIVTYHDIGLNSTSCFQGFFNYPEMQVILKSFCVYHLNALGQYEGAPTLPSGLGLNQAVDPETYVFPTMEQLSEMILPIVDHFKIKAFIGFGVGAGANILSRFALLHPERVDALVLINCTASKAGWIEWGYQKWNAWYLKSGVMTTGVEEYLLWHWFGNKTMETNYDLVKVYQEYIKSLNPVNLGHFVSSYIARSDLGIERAPYPQQPDPSKSFRCPAMIVTGDYSPHNMDTVDMNGRTDPTKCTWMKFECGGMVMEEAPGKLAEAFRLFLQGLGYVPLLKPSHEDLDSSLTKVSSSRYSTSRIYTPPKLV